MLQLKPKLGRMRPAGWA